MTATVATSGSIERVIDASNDSPVTVWAIPIRIRWASEDFLALTDDGSTRAKPTTLGVKSYTILPSDSQVYTTPPTWDSYNNDNPHDDPKSKTKQILIPVGILVGIILLTAILVCLTRRRKKSLPESVPDSENDPAPPYSEVAGRLYPLTEVITPQEPPTGSGGTNEQGVDHTHAGDMPPMVPPLIKNPLVNAGTVFGGQLEPKEVEERGKEDTAGDEIRLLRLEQEKRERLRQLEEIEEEEARIKQRIQELSSLEKST